MLGYTGTCTAQQLAPMFLMHFQNAKQLDLIRLSEALLAGSFGFPVDQPGEEMWRFVSAATGWVVPS